MEGSFVDYINLMETDREREEALTTFVNGIGLDTVKILKRVIAQYEAVNDPKLLQYMVGVHVRRLTPEEIDLALHSAGTAERRINDGDLTAYTKLSENKYDVRKNFLRQLQRKRRIRKPESPSSESNSDSEFDIESVGDDDAYRTNPDDLPHPNAPTIRNEANISEASSPETDDDDDKEIKANKRRTRLSRRILTSDEDDATPVGLPTKRRRSSSSSENDSDNERLAAKILSSPIRKSKRSQSLDSDSDNDYQGSDVDLPFEVESSESDSSSSSSSPSTPWSMTSDSSKGTYKDRARKKNTRRSKKVRVALHTCTVLIVCFYRKNALYPFLATMTMTMLVLAPVAWVAERF